jgi:hypothetical protein
MRSVPECGVRDPGTGVREEGTTRPGFALLRRGKRGGDTERGRSFAGCGLPLAEGRARGSGTGVREDGTTRPGFVLLRRGRRRGGLRRAIVLPTSNQRARFRAWGGHRFILYRLSRSVGRHRPGEPYSLALARSGYCTACPAFLSAYMNSTSDAVLVRKGEYSPSCQAAIRSVGS